MGDPDFINYTKNPNWDITIKEVARVIVVNHQLEVVSGESLNKSIKSIHTEGNIVLMGFLEIQFTNLNLMRMLISRANIQSVCFLKKLKLPMNI